MRPFELKRAAGVALEAAQDIARDTLNATLAPTKAQPWLTLALLLYNAGARSSAKTQAASTRHTEWTSS